MSLEKLYPCDCRCRGCGQTFKSDSIYADVCPNCLKRPASTSPTQTSVHAATEDAISKDRQKIYGDPKESHDLIAMSWTAYLVRAGFLAQGKTLSGRDVAALMVLLKIQRGAAQYDKDSVDDGVNYLRFLHLWTEHGK